jgi:hypothetical protein
VWQPIERAERSAGWFTRSTWPQTIAMVVAVVGALGFGALVLKLIGGG